MQVSLLDFRDHVFDVGSKFRNGHAAALVVFLAIDIFGGRAEEKCVPQSLGEVQAEGEPIRVRQGINKVVDEFGTRAANFAVLTADGIDGPGTRPEQAGDFIGVETGGIDDAARFDRFGLGLLLVADAKGDADEVFVRFEGFHFCVGEQAGALLFGEAGIGVDEILGGADASGRNMQGGISVDVRFFGADLRGVQNLQALDCIFLPFF